MYFDFDESRPDAPSFDGVMSRREGVLISIIGHLVALIVLLVAPSLPFVKEAVERRAQEAAVRTAQLLEQQRAQQRQAERFVFVEPLIDVEAPEPPDAGMLSDRDRIATAPERSADPTNPLPFARGNSAELVIAPDVVETPRGDGPALDPAEGEVDGAVESDIADEYLDTADMADMEASEADRVSEGERELDDREAVDGAGQFDPGELGATGLDPPRIASRSAPRAVQPPLSGGALGEAIRNLERYVDRESLDNPGGDGGQYGPSIQFDTKGVEFGPWIRRFIAQIKRNWLVPYAAMAFKGHTVLTFNVHKNGALTDVTVIEPSAIDGFNSSARNALLASNPTQPLPPEYPSDQAFFTVTFYYNERPPY
ncbi:MAG: TonB C-terminal domain-containing protein [Vicinamibacterales bacterium]|jgi:hypothetical protein|nr:hypothetical protein [Acidobacteriota bacterium]MDP6371471.1 TonB C-terminal domain-containing protein [Vicinamibacterales bacterium]MDP6609382.1 TonB C-terminal domain-containing protein [Vicinamibacterales bacterium]HAK54227.1 hypothetical protein [Acidobacteriota bacterium]|tara:strand:+ start:412 stop:1518 length:1107 start_codon:yes stop_codon:yes gene_type:complete